MQKAECRVRKLRRPRYGSAVIPNTAEAVDLVLCFCGSADMHSSSIIYLPIQLAKMYFLERRSFTADCFVAQANSDAVYPPPTRQCCCSAKIFGSKYPGKSCQLLNASACICGSYQAYWLTSVADIPGRTRTLDCLACWESRSAWPWPAPESAAEPDGIVRAGR